MNPLLVGQAPGRTGGRERAFDGESGLRLAKVLGMTLPELLAAFDTVNLLPKWPGKHGGKYPYRGKGDRFPLWEARRRALALDVSRYSVIVLAGRMVARAFDVDPVPLQWSRFGRSRLLVIPHPSGCNQFYNSPFNRADAAFELGVAMLAAGLDGNIPRSCLTGSTATSTARTSCSAAARPTAG